MNTSTNYKRKEDRVLVYLYNLAVKAVPGGGETAALFMLFSCILPIDTCLSVELFLLM
jgi:hypothetical protein